MRPYDAYFQKKKKKELHEGQQFFHTLENRCLKVEHIDVALKVRSHTGEQQLYPQHSSR